MMLVMTTNATTPRISLQQYKAAADRIRRGASRLGDEAICNAWDAQQLLAPRATVRNWWDTPVAARCWATDGRDVER